MSCPDSFEFVESDTATWQQVAFPFCIKEKIGGHGYNRYLNLNMVKSMLDQMELKQFRDFVFNNRKTLETSGQIVVQFKDKSNATIATIKWLGSDWYNGRT